MLDDVVWRFAFAIRPGYDQVCSSRHEHHNDNFLERLSLNTTGFSLLSGCILAARGNESPTKLERGLHVKRKLMHKNTTKKSNADYVGCANIVSMSSG
uniref:Uncharacterized protein n=1 Tax=Globisporangium ultimum (strain ATCC 200006 / CBS 805.95 / DAOM BR144) TaxID=431595 RepID=K3WND1_GLOUD